MSKRTATEYPGVFFREVRRIGGPGLEKVFYVVFKLKGKLYEEKVGRQYADDMTAARAARYRGDRIEGRRLSRKELREGQQDRSWTFDKLWEEYQRHHPGASGLKSDRARYRLHIQPDLGGKVPSELAPLDVDRIRLRLAKTKKPGTVCNVLEVVRRLLNFAKKKALCATPGFLIEMPQLNNETTEDLTAEEMQRLLHVLRSETLILPSGQAALVDPDARDLMLLALTTGMRRMEMLSLMWADVDTDRGFLRIREPKSRQDATIPLNDEARAVLASRARTEGNPFVFPGKGAGHRSVPEMGLRAIKTAAGLPETFRFLHGCRHTFASHLVSSGVDLFVVGKLLNHRDIGATRRYSHLRDSTLRAASALAGAVLSTQGADQGGGEVQKVS